MYIGNFRQVVLFRRRGTDFRFRGAATSHRVFGHAVFSLERNSTMDTSQIRRHRQGNVVASRDHG